MKKLVSALLAVLLVLSAACAFAEGEILIGQVDYAAHGTSCFAVVTIAVQGDVIVAALIDEFQYGAADAVTPVPNSEGMAANVAEGKVLYSKRANAAYYKRIASSVSGVGSVSVIGCARGAGTVDVYVLGTGGTTVSDATLAQVQSLLSEARELNVDVLACRPEEVSVTLYIRITMEPGYQFSTVAGQVQTAVTDYIDSLGIGGDVLLSKVGEVIYHIKGVSDYRFLENYGSNRIISDSRYASADNIIVREG